jgi:hypothetical protein
MQSQMIQITYDELEPEELIWVDEALSAGVRQVDHRNLKKIASAGGAAIYRYLGKTPRVRGVVVLQLNTKDNGSRELYVWLLGGRHIAQEYKLIQTLIEKIASMAQADSLRCHTTRKLAKFYAKHLGWQQDLTQMIKELSNGRR